jgi:excisionase family DNA binding protein
MSMKGKKRQRSGRQSHAVTPAEVPAQPDSPLLTMPEAIQALKTSRPTFYRWVRSGQIKAQKVGRQWRFRREDLDRFMNGDAPLIELQVDIAPLVSMLRDRLSSFGQQKVVDELSKAVGPVEQAVSLMILVSVAMNADEIHLMAHSLDGRPSGALRYRVNGALDLFATFDVRLLPGLVQEWKRLAACDIREKEKPQDGRVQMKVGDKTLTVAVSFLPSHLGESIVVRRIDSSRLDLKLEHLGYRSQDMEKLRRAVKSRWGIIVVTGPRESGKTTTLYSCLNELASPATQIVSIENSVEVALPWVNQMAVNPAAGVTFAQASRAMMRAAPDVMHIGEIRDAETLAIAQQGALDGRLVLIPMFTDEAASALRRMVDLGGNPLLIADTVRLIVAQRLLRGLCSDCSVEEAPSSDLLDRARKLVESGGLAWSSLPGKFKKANGCDKCNHTGYRGRILMAEMLEVTSDIATAVRASAPAMEVRSIAVGHGMTTMAADGIRLAASGATSLVEVLRHSHFY